MVLQPFRTSSRYITTIEIHILFYGSPTRSTKSLAWTHPGCWIPSYNNHHDLLLNLDDIWMHLQVTLPLHRTQWFEQYRLSVMPYLHIFMCSILLICFLFVYMFMTSSLCTRLFCDTRQRSTGNQSNIPRYAGTPHTQLYIWDPDVQYSSIL